ncbi:hypothetical protein [Paraburkholderia heleia]|uniref:hypothetical protein n=1 Tax=Paraburkholderia heleia TaxID=634127 RepID=UPI0038992CDC
MSRLLGQHSGHMGAGNMIGLTASYTTGPISVIAGFQQNSDNSNNKQQSDRHLDRPFAHLIAFF